MMSNSLQEKLELIGSDVEDVDLIWKAAHNIKGSAMQCGLESLAEAAKVLERAYRTPVEKDLEDRDGYKKKFIEESRRVINTAQRLLNSSS